MNFSRYLAAAAVALTAAGATSVAHARDVHFSVGAYVAPGVHVGVSNAPVYYPRPVYVQPAPVYVQPAPIYYAPPPVYYRPAPVYYGAAPVYYGAAPVYYERPYRKHKHHWKHHKHHRDWDD